MQDMFKKIINFIKYHNAFAIGFMIVFVGFSLSLAASPELRENFQEALISSQEVIQSIDNSYVLAANLDDFDFGLQIKEITEDEKNYYITYGFKTIAIQDYVWQELEKEKILTVSQEALANRDLGLYVAEELGEVIDYERAYLKEVQKSEKEKGLTQKIVTIQYAGLIGRFLNPEEKVFSGYEPVVLPPEIVIQSEPQPQPEPPQPNLQAEPQFEPVPQLEPVATSSVEPLPEAVSTVATSTQIEEVIIVSEASTTATSTTTNNSSTASIDSTTTTTITELPAATSTTEFPVPAPTASPQLTSTSTPGS